MTRKFKERLQKRNALIKATYERLRNEGYELLEAKEMLAKQHGLTLVTIYRILKGE